ncbi:hypothetical protein EVG20_g4523 [Dentipellis fragilis]|uniref:Uncharacterized protein n=1 Tax=Dentipellis fragilis TaxID=205917 RepID=A0A4Y9YVX6_9AGAM|nr:hypothetical protein EVG20_g4523 [Dentipellis fragilis]
MAPARIHGHQDGYGSMNLMLVSTTLLTRLNINTMWAATNGAEERNHSAATMCILLTLISTIMLVLLLTLHPCTLAMTILAGTPQQCRSSGRITSALGERDESPNPSQCASAPHAEGVPRKTPNTLTSPMLSPNPTA